MKKNAESILFDVKALLVSLKAHIGYHALRAARARSNEETSDHEAKLVEEILTDTREQFDVAMAQASRLVKELTRELRIIAELPGRATMPLSKKRNATKAAKLTCQELLQAIQPLADSLNTPREPLEIPEITCMPENINLDQYLQVLRWLVEDDESLKAIAFPYEPGTHNLVGVIPAALKARVDTTWSALDESKRAAVIDKVAAQTLVAVTNKRIIRASPRKLVTEGHIRDSIPLGEVQFVRSRNMQNQSVRPTIDVITNTKDVSWMFPKQADTEQIDLLSQVLENGKNDSQPTSQLRLGILNLKPSVCCKVWRQILDFNQN